MSYRYQAQLATWRARVGPSEAMCLALFGVGRETLQRIETGEVDPEPDIGARIDLELELSGNISSGGGLVSPLSLAPPGSSPAHGDGPFGAGAVLRASPGAGCGGVAFDGAPVLTNRGAR